MNDLDNQIICPICSHTVQEGERICQRCRIDLETMMPEKPSAMNRFWQFAISVPLLLFGLISLIILGKGILVPALVLMAIGGFVLYAAISGYTEDLRLYKLAQTDYDKFMEENRARWAEVNAAIDKNNTEHLSRIPTCPICGSKSNVRRLGNLDRTVSTAVWGAASSAIGKQWECTHCNHKFNVDVAAPAPSQAESKPKQQDPAEELRRYKQLLDEGLITTEDYEQKKKQLLGL